MKVDGICHCGRIRFEAEIDPASVTICHCTDCQVLSGSAFRTVALTRPGSFRLLSGSPRIYVKTADSGNKRQQAFCGDCGTPLYSAPHGEEAKIHGLRVGSLRQREQLAPVRQIWYHSHLNWLDGLQDIAKVETQHGFDPRSGLQR